MFARIKGFVLIRTDSVQPIDGGGNERALPPSCVCPSAPSAHFCLMADLSAPASAAPTSHKRTHGPESLSGPRYPEEVALFCLTM